MGLLKLAAVLGTEEFKDSRKSKKKGNGATKFPGSLTMVPQFFLVTNKGQSW
jgi:hypothetical protein